MITNVYEMANLIHKFAQSDGCIGCKFKRECNGDCLKTINELLLNEEKCKEMFKNEDDIIEYGSDLLSETIERTKKDVYQFCSHNKVFGSIFLNTQDVVNGFATEKLNNYVAERLEWYRINYNKDILQVHCELFIDKEEINLSLCNVEEFMNFLKKASADEIVYFKDYSIIETKYNKYKHIPIIIHEGE